MRQCRESLAELHFHQMRLGVVVAVVAAEVEVEKHHDVHCSKAIPFDTDSLLKQGKFDDLMLEKYLKI